MTARRLYPAALALLLAVAVYALGTLAMFLHPAYGLTYHDARYHTSTSAVVATIRAEARRAHLGSVDTAALLSIGRYESNYHAVAVNHHGSGCYGVFQLSAGMVRGHAWWDVAWNTRRAIAYMRGRYGSPRRALAFRRRHGWY